MKPHICGFIIISLDELVNRINSNNLLNKANNGFDPAHKMQYAMWHICHIAYYILCAGSNPLFALFSKLLELIRLTSSSKLIMMKPHICGFMNRHINCRNRLILGKDRVANQSLRCYDAYMHHSTVTTNLQPYPFQESNDYDS